MYVVHHHQQEAEMLQLGVFRSRVSGRWHWRIANTGNGEIIARSSGGLFGGYKRRWDMEVILYNLADYMGPSRWRREVREAFRRYQDEQHKRGRVAL